VRVLAATVGLLVQQIAGSPCLLAQADSALAFLPLQVGNMWQYHYRYSNCGQTHSSYYLERVVGDTVLPTGFRYFVVESDLSGEDGWRFLRVDSSTANIYRYESSSPARDLLVDSLRATKGSTFIREGWITTECTGVDTLTVLGQHVVVKRFVEYYLFGGEYTLAYGVGRVSRVTYDEDLCYPILQPLYQDLVYAKISGEEFGTLVGVTEPNQKPPSSFTLEHNYPNPFNTSTVISYALPCRAHVTLTVFTALGQKVRVLVDEEKEAGYHRVQFDASGLASGTYFCRLRSGAFTRARAVLLQK
jgi:hypothetical protein